MAGSSFFYVPVPSHFVGCPRFFGDWFPSGPWRTYFGCMLFYRNRDRIPSGYSEEKVAFFGEEVQLYGFIQTIDPLRISGRLEGSIFSRSRVILESNSSVQGDINCHDAEIHGRVIGDLDVKGALRLKGQAAVDGDVAAARIQVDDGVSLNGKCVTKVDAGAS